MRLICTLFSRRIWQRMETQWRPEILFSTVNTAGQTTQGDAMLDGRSGNSTLPTDPEASEAAGLAETATISLRSLFSSNRRQMLLTYGLFNIENLLRLAQPFVLGWAINDLLRGASLGLWLFVAQHLTHLAIGTFRQMYDTRAFTSVYTDLATRLVVDQRRRAIDVSRVAARSALSREYVEFFERYVPMIMRSGYSVVGALAMLAYYDLWLVPICLALLLPAYVINRRYARQTRRISRRLHDELENEVDVIEPGNHDRVRGHYHAVAGWRIKLSDSEAVNFAAMEFFVLGVLVATLLRFCTTPDADAGRIFAVFRYVLMLIMGFDALPKLVQQLSRLRDIDSRLTTETRP